MFKFQYPHFYGKSSSKAVKNKTHTFNSLHRCDEKYKQKIYLYNFFQEQFLHLSLLLWKGLLEKKERTVFKVVSQQACIYSPFAK